LEYKQTADQYKNSNDKQKFHQKMRGGVDWSEKICYAAACFALLSVRSQSSHHAQNSKHPISFVPIIDALYIDGAAKFLRAQHRDVSS
jgi:hypothetical protein